MCHALEFRLLELFVISVEALGILGRLGLAARKRLLLRRPQLRHLTFDKSVRGQASATKTQWVQTLSRTHRSTQVNTTADQNCCPR